MQIAIGADHAGFRYKQILARELEAAGHEVLDLGTDSTDPVDYPEVAETVALAVVEGRAERGVLICGSAVGVSVAANKVPGIRAGVCHDGYSAHQAVEHDDANVLCLGQRVIGVEVARELLRTFLAARFSGAERHRRRRQQVLALETRYRKRLEDPAR